MLIICLIVHFIFGTIISYQSFKDKECDLPFVIKISFPLTLGLFTFLGILLKVGDFIVEKEYQFKLNKFFQSIKAKKERGCSMPIKVNISPDFHYIITEKDKQVLQWVQENGIELTLYSIYDQKEAYILLEDRYEKRKKFIDSFLKEE